MDIAGHAAVVWACFQLLAQVALPIMLTGTLTLLAAGLLLGTAFGAIRSLGELTMRGAGRLRQARREWFGRPGAAWPARWDGSGWQDNAGSERLDGLGKTSEAGVGWQGGTGSTWQFAGRSGLAGMDRIGMEYEVRRGQAGEGWSGVEGTSEAGVDWMGKDSEGRVGEAG